MPLNRATLLHDTSDVTVSRFDHPPHQIHHDPDREVAERWGIAFVRAGNFDVVIDGVRHPMTAGSVFITRPGLAFRCGHGEECPDDVCLSVGFSCGAVAGGEDAWERAGWSARPVATPRLAYVQRRMAMAVDGNDQFEIERWALAGLTALSADSSTRRVRGHYAVRPADIDRIVASCRSIEADPVAHRSIGARASAVGLTSTRLTHGFQRYLGVSPHQFVVRHRLAVAAELLNQGESVTASCYGSGFENLSHFCRTFQRAFGLRASEWRALTLRESRRKVQDFLGSGR